MAYRVTILGSLYALLATAYLELDDYKKMETMRDTLSNHSYYELFINSISILVKQNATLWQVLTFLIADDQRLNGKLEITFQ